MEMTCTITLAYSILQPEYIFVSGLSKAINLAVYFNDFSYSFLV